MVDNKIKVQLRSSSKDSELLRINDLVDQLTALRDTLGKLDRLISRKNKSSMYLRFVAMSYSSPLNYEVELVPLKQTENYTEAIVSRFIRGIEGIQRGYAPDEYGREMLESFRSHIKPVKRRTTVDIEYSSNGNKVTINENLSEQVAKILGEDEFEVGNVSGLLEVLNIHGGANRFNIYPIAGADKVECHFPKELLDDAIKGVNKYVSLQGRLKYKKRDRFPYEIDLIESIEVFPNEEELPTIFDLKGIAPDATNGLSSEEFIANLRYGQ